jgi:hypothetical protein
MMTFPNNFAILQHNQYTILKKRLDEIKLVCLLMPSYFHGGDGPSGVGIEVEFPFVILAVVLPAIVLPLAVWSPWIVVCASADIAPKFIDASTPATNIPIATIVTPNLKLFFMCCYTAKLLFKDYHKADFWSMLICEIRTKL